MPTNCEHCAALAAKVHELERERDEQRARAITAEHHKSLSLLGRSSYAQVQEDKLREQLAIVEIERDELRAQVQALTEALKKEARMSARNGRTEAERENL